MNLGMLLMDFDTFCADSETIWNVVGWIFTVFKIVIPILLIILGSIDFGKAVVAQKDDEIKSAAKSFAFRAVAAIVIFILPSVITMIINWALDISGTEMDYQGCTNCVIHPGSGCSNK